MTAAESQTQSKQKRETSVQTAGMSDKQLELANEQIGEVYKYVYAI